MCQDVVLGVDMYVCPQDHVCEDKHVCKTFSIATGGLATKFQEMETERTKAPNL